MCSTKVFSSAKRNSSKFVPGQHLHSADNGFQCGAPSLIQQVYLVNENEGNVTKERHASGIFPLPCQRIELFGRCEDDVCIMKLLQVGDIAVA